LVAIGRRQAATSSWGVEGDILGLSHRDGGGEIYRFTVLPSDHFNTTDRSSTQGSVRLRLGFAVDRTLWYIAGGWTRARLDVTRSFVRDGDGSLTFDSSTTRDGWNIGAGAEYALVNNWTLGLEYRYTDYGSFSRSVPGGTAGTLAWSAFTVSADNLHTSDVRLRLNYLFGGPLVGR
jgi:opacity protein-like surface antigen